MAKCLFPYYVERKSYHRQEDRLVPVPCGKCPECLKRRASSWAFRIHKESKHWPQLFFSTLTYDPDHLPKSPNNFSTLVKKDLQDFFKRLRKASGGKLKYYACGEYGTNFKRPHYHCIILADDSVTESIINNCWTAGGVFHGKVEVASIYYTIHYYEKGDWYPQHAKDDREPEFQVMSKGLGKSWLTPVIQRYIESRPDAQYIYFNGHKIAIPRYYRKKVLDDNPILKQQFINSSLKLNANDNKLFESEEDYQDKGAYLEQWKRNRKSKRK